MDEDAFKKLVNYYSTKGDFDHPDMEEITEESARFEVEPITAAQAFFVARERQALREGEILDGGDGSEAERTKLIGEMSIHELLFGKNRKSNDH